MTKQSSSLTSGAAKGIPTFGPYELYILALSVFSIVILGLDSLTFISTSTHEVLGYADTALCLFFFADFLRTLKGAPARGSYLIRSGWLDFLSSIPAIGILRLGRLSRIVRIIRLLRAVRSVRTIGQTIARHRQQSALLAATMVVLILTVFASIAILQFEQDPESNIQSAGDALWWAFATITTVGYGDRFPVTLEGRLIAAMLMAAGVALFGTLSGLVASWFLNSETPADTASTDAIAALTKEVAALRMMLIGDKPYGPQ